jgi:hypothetical protein
VLKELRAQKRMPSDMSESCSSGGVSEFRIELLRQVVVPPVPSFERNKGALQRPALRRRPRVCPSPFLTSRSLVFPALHLFVHRLRFLLLLLEICFVLSMHRVAEIFLPTNHQERPREGAGSYAMARCLLAERARGGGGAPPGAPPPPPPPPRGPVLQASIGP